MFGIMAVVYQKDSTTLVVNLGSGMCSVGFTGYHAPCVMFPSGVAKPKMLCILAGMDQIMVQSGVSAVAVHSGRRHLFSCAVNVPVVQVVLAITVVVNDRCARLRLCRKSSRFRSCRSSSSSTIPCCGAEADSHGPCDHGDFTVAVH